MNLNKKKKLTERTFGVGKERIVFLESRLNDIKEAITKQDIRDLYNDGAIIIKEKKGRKKRHGWRKTKGRSAGNIRKKVRIRKREYVVLARKLRKHLADLKSQGKITDRVLKEMRKKIRNKAFKSKMQLREQIGGLVK